MLIIKHTVETTLPPDAIWKVWEDVSNWNTWDNGIEFSTLDGPFVSGTKGTVKPKAGPLIKTQLSLVEPNKRFVDEAKLPLAQLYFEHSLSKQNGKTLITHKIEIKGLLAFFFAFVIGREMKKNLPREMRSMIQKAEELYG